MLHEIRLKDFIDSVQTKGAKINVDSLSKLNSAELDDYKEKAHKRPLHIQVDTIVIDGKKEPEKYAWFSPGLNIIVLNYFLIDSAYLLNLIEFLKKSLSLLIFGQNCKITTDSKIAKFQHGMLCQAKKRNKEWKFFLNFALCIKKLWEKFAMQ